MNLPGGVTSGFRLEVRSSTGVGWIKQIMYPNGDVQRIWIRQCGDGWTNWYSILTNADVTTKDFTKNATITENGFLSLNFSVGVSGYTPLGIIMESIVNASTNGANSSGCSIYSQTLKNNTVNLLIKNFAPANAVVDVSIRCLYIRT